MNTEAWRLDAMPRERLEDMGIAPRTEVNNRISGEHGRVPSVSSWRSERLRRKKGKNLPALSSCFVPRDVNPPLADFAVAANGRNEGRTTANEHLVE